MNIRIINPEKTVTFRLLIPRKLLSVLAAAKLRKAGIRPTATSRQIECLFRQLDSAGKRNGSWLLAEIETTDGKTVQIEW